jgi:hypothetical protein
LKLQVLETPLHQPSPYFWHVTIFPPINFHERPMHESA